MRSSILIFKWCKQKYWNYFLLEAPLIGWEETVTVCKGACAINRIWTVQIETRPSMFAQDAMCIYILLLEFGSKQWHTKGTRMAVFKYLCSKVFHHVHQLVVSLPDCTLITLFLSFFHSSNKMQRISVVCISCTYMLMREIVVLVNLHLDKLITHNTLQVP